MSKDRLNFPNAVLLHIPLPNTDDVYSFGKNVQVWLGEVLGAICRETTRFPVLIHCKSGKDRTGVVVAAILVLLGYSDEEIIRDFMKTPRAVASKLARTLKALRTSDVTKYIVNKIGTNELSAFRERMSSSPSCAKYSYLGQIAMKNLDNELMSTHGFKLEQLMELAGLSVAAAITDKYHVSARTRDVLVICGPGNNGGDGIVAARHLWHFGYKPTLVYPRLSNMTNNYFGFLITQVRDLGIPVLSETPTDWSTFSLAVDALFGFSFKGSPRAPYGAIIESLNKFSGIIVSVDVPSGWDVENGPSPHASLPSPSLLGSANRTKNRPDLPPQPEIKTVIKNTPLRCPDMLVSLSVPKLCARFFTGRYHMLGGRFIPPAVANKYKLKLPKFAGSKQVVEIIDRGLFTPAGQSSGGSGKL